MLGLRRFVLLLGSWASLVVGSSSPAQEPGYAFATPGFDGSFANVLGDRLELTQQGRRATGKFAALGSTVAVQGSIEQGRFTGTTTGVEPARSCRGEFHGEVLHFALGEETWRLRPVLAMVPAVADLGAPELDPERQWTIAVYLGADNDLEAGALADLLELHRGMPKQGVEVVVLIDRAKGFASSETDWTDSRLLRVRPAPEPAFVELAKPGELDTGSPGTLASLMAGAFRKFPAQNHALFVWDHGGGWTGIVTDLDAPGTQRGRSQLSLADVRAAVRSGLLQSGVLRLDLIGFDACMMAQLEVALAVADLASVMVASEAVVPGTGFQYDHLLGHFASSTDPKQIASSIVADYAKFSEQEFESGSTLSAFDLSFAPAVAGQLDRLARALLPLAATQWPAIARALFYAECYEVRTARTGDDAFGSVDLLDLMSRLRSVPGLDPTAIDDLEITFAGMLKNRHQGAERTLSHGLAIYGPHRQGQYDANYRTTPLGLGSAWPQLLQRVHEQAAKDQGELRVAEFRQLTALGQPTTVAHPFGGERLLFTATGASIVEVQQHDLQFDEGAKIWLLLRQQLVTDPLWPQRWAKAAAADLIDLVMPEYQDGKNELYTELSGMTFAITNGEIQAYATLDMSTPSMQAPITVVARRETATGGEPQLVQIAFDRASWKAVSVRPIERPTPGAAARAIEPASQDKFSFRIETRALDGTPDSIFTAPIEWGEHGLQLLPEFDEAGRYRVVMQARTIHGRTASAHHDYTVADNPDLVPWGKSWEGFDWSTLVGTWSQFLVTGPQQYRDLKMTAEVATDPLGERVFRVVQKGGPTGIEYETHPRWWFGELGLLCLRIVTEVEDGQTFCWYGPARIGQKDGKPFLVMKALNAGGVVWEWRKR